MEDVNAADVAYRKVAHGYKKGIPETQNTRDQINVQNSKVLNKRSLCPLSPSANDCSQSFEWSSHILIYPISPSLPLLWALHPFLPRLHLCSKYVQCPHRPKSIQLPGTSITGRCEPPCGFENSLGPLQEHQVLLAVSHSSSSSSSF